GFLIIPLLGIPFAAAAAYLFGPRPNRDPNAPPDYVLVVRVGAGHPPEALLAETFAKHLEHSRLTATVTARQGAAFELTYGVRLRRTDGVVALVAELNGLPGVQNVELRQA